MPNLASLEELEKVNKKLISIAEERVRAEERLKASMKTLKALGSNTVEEAEAAREDIISRHTKLSEKLMADYEDFIKEFEAALQ